MKTPLLTLLLIAATLAAAASPAHAGPYVLVGCAELNGALGPAHVARPADGWFHEQGVSGREECAKGRSGRLPARST